VLSSTIFQASSESSIGFTVPDSEAGRAVAALKRAFREELQTGLIDGISSRGDAAVVAVVGNGMAGTPGISARVFAALAAGGVNVIAIAQGSSELNISFVVGGAQAAEAARRIHGAFQLSKIGGGRSPEAPRTDVAARLQARRASLADQARSRNGSSQVRVVAPSIAGYVFDHAGSAASPAAPGPGQRTRAAPGLLGGRKADTRRPLPSSRATPSRPALVDVTAEDRRPAARGPRPGLRPRARQQEAARRLRPELRKVAGRGRRGGTPHPL
jgi:aspartokinase/homoserine dehydrogenase 1